MQLFLLSFGILLFLVGCTETTMSTTYPYRFNRLQLIEYDKSHYYTRPLHSWSQKLTANMANLNNVASGELLDCKENDIWFISLNEREREGKVRYRYWLTLSKQQLMKMEDNRTYIPREDSREFKDLQSIDSELNSQKLIGCSPMLPEAKYEKMKTRTLPKVAEI